jgi:hypothetical protein
MSSLSPSPRTGGCWWCVALFGQFVFVFSALALSGPGRIDIDDGQVRFEVAASLVDHGDCVVRDPVIWYTILPGRDGQRYSNCRLPQSALGTVAIVLADATGPRDVGRRHFFFQLTSAFAAAVLAVTYTLLFRHLGLGPWAALGWATAGIFCTPSWYYGTSTFDDILGATAVVLAVTVALVSRHRRPLTGALLAGLLVGLAFNCKQPLGIFVFAVLAANRDTRLGWRAQAVRVGIVMAGVAVGVALYEAFDYYKFPPGTTAAHAAILAQWPTTWRTNPLPGLAALTVSPAAGALWYCPPVLLGLVGLACWFRPERCLCAAVVAGSAVFIAFLCFLTFFKGDLCWGPRYLTPIYALFWILVPAGATRLQPRLVHLILLAGLTVQGLALSVDPHRLYLQRQLCSGFYVVDPWLYFEPALSHLGNRPREIAEILRGDQPPAVGYSPSVCPTYCPPILEWTPGGPRAVSLFTIYGSFRPWWISQQDLDPGERPVALGPTVALLVAWLAAGLGCMCMGARRLSRVVRGECCPAREAAAAHEGPESRSDRFGATTRNLG